MKRLRKKTPVLLIIIIIFSPGYLFSEQAMECWLPIYSKNRQSWKTVQLTSIGQFGELRRARPKIPAHLHTGIDFKRPNTNYENEYIFPIMSGRIISLRADGPFSQIIIEHNHRNLKAIWSVYEHVAGIIGTVGDSVNPDYPIARFMNRNELDQYGWQFDHFHFEILKKRPRSLRHNAKTPFRFFGTYCLECYSKTDLEKYYYNPKEYFKSQWLH